MIIELYTRDTCATCQRAKALLRERDIPFRERIVDKDIPRETLMTRYPTAKVLPVVVVDGEYIGTLEQLKEHIDGPPISGQGGDDAPK